MRINGHGPQHVCEVALKALYQKGKTMVFGVHPDFENARVGS